MNDWHYPGLPAEDEAANPCSGCHECGLRCTAGVQMTQPEFDLIVAHLRLLDPSLARRVLNQNKQVPWFEDIFREACLFYDVNRQGCLVYPARPLICRLFGRVEWLPCPLGKRLPLVRRGVQVMQTYAREPRATFGEWCMAQGIFDPCQVIQEP